MQTIVPNTFLKRALGADAALSGAVALLQLAVPTLLAAQTGLAPALLIGTGVFLVGYVALLIVLATRARLWAPLVWFVVAGNAGWAVAALVVSQEQALSALGQAFAFVHAVAVSVFAWLEYRGLATSSRAGAVERLPA